nr:23 kDa jasmonate-induced protein-like [Ziziphus jujuba var. spinosa]
MRNMAAVPVNFFGDAVTDETVRKYFPDKKVITRKDRTYLAYNLKEAGNKHEKAKVFLVKQLNEWYGDDGSAVTLGTIYNATGDTLTYFKHHDLVGHVQGPQYPIQIQNGQWAAFLHVGSHATVLYSGRNNEGAEAAWLHAWYNKTDEPTRRYVFTEIQSPHHYDPSDIWMYVTITLG